MPHDAKYPIKAMGCRCQGYSAALDFYTLGCANKRQISHPGAVVLLLISGDCCSLQKYFSEMEHL